MTNRERSRHSRLPAALALSFAVVGVMMACSCGGGSSTTSTRRSHNGTISLCAVDPLQARDFPAAGCGGGTYAAVNTAAEVELQAEDPNGHPLSNTPLTITRDGINRGAASVTTGANGQATYSYQSSHIGSDTVTATVTGGGAVQSGSVVIDWIPNHAMTRGIIWVHGIHEDATDFAHEIHGTLDPDQASDRTEQTWTSLLGALTTAYNPSAIQAFCYVDDLAWTNPTSGCPDDEQPFRTCTGATTCLSEGSVDASALALATLVQDMSNTYHHAVTLMAYSMGGAIVRTFLAGCITPPASSGSPPGPARCASQAGLVDHVFLSNAAQEGSWLLTAKKQGLNPAGMVSTGSPFTTVMPLIENFLYAKVKDQLGLDLNQQAITDLTPQSQNILDHNSRLPISGPDFYTFYGDVRLGIQMQYLAFKLPPTAVLPLGDLVMLPQADPARATPVWGGAALCQGCQTEGPGYSADPSNTYHEWALTQSVTIPMSGLIPLLSVPDAVSGLQTALNSPVQHLNVSQPATQDPGSSIKVFDITHLAGASTTNMSNEIYLILVHADHLE